MDFRFTFVQASRQALTLKYHKIVNAQIGIKIILSLLFQERQQFHLEQLRAAEFRARATAQQQLARENQNQSGGVAGQPTLPPPQQPQSKIIAPTPTVKTATRPTGFAVGSGVIFAD